MKEVKKQGGLNAEIQSRIGHQLRAMYDDVVRQGVPDRFAELIRKLDGPGSGRPKSTPTKTTGGTNASHRLTSRRHSGVGAEPARVRDLALAAMATAPTTWCRKRCCARIANIDSFQPGSNLPAWLFTILRNLFRSDYRKRRREVEDAEGNYAKTLKTQPAQNAHLEFEEFRAALDKLPQDQREALILVGASGFSYEDAAAICGCAVGTIKSRVNRARSKLQRPALCRRRRGFRPRRHRARGDRRQRRLMTHRSDTEKAARSGRLFVIVPMSTLAASGAAMREAVTRRECRATRARLRGYDLVRVNATDEPLPHRPHRRG